MTLDEFGREVLLGKAYLSKLERGRRLGLSTRSVDLICGRLRVKREWLVEGTGDPFDSMEEPLPTLDDLSRKPLAERRRQSAAMGMAMLGSMVCKTPSEVLDQIIAILKSRPLSAQSLDAAGILAESLRPHLPNKFLPNITEVSNRKGVEAELDKLIARVRKSASAPGKKAALADFLGVPRPRVSEWLAGRTAPGGETTLRLLHWVEQEESRGS
ncbi:MAG: hypothetical protein M5U12_09550 [Verrucomicrobia bacterium]|nr:hypothetical protein [Verrucomicrobiota bacterium]